MAMRQIFLFVGTQGEVSRDSQLIRLRDTISNSLILGVFIDVVDQLLVQSRLFGLNGPPPLYLPLNLTQEMTQLDHWKRSMGDKQTEQKGSSCNVLKNGFLSNIASVNPTLLVPVSFTIIQQLVAVFVIFVEQFTIVSCGSTVQAIMKM